MQPMFYRLLPGSIKDVSSLLLSIKESGVKDIIIIGDKGFYSENNIKELDIGHRKYIFPLKRNSSLIDYSPIAEAGRKGFKGHFIFEKRVIWYYEREENSKRIVTFVDGRLKVEEEEDYLIRANDDKDKLNEFYENKKKSSTITIITGTNLGAQKIFELLKSRTEIEVVFDTFKNNLHADRSYMGDDFALEGWMFVNFIALLLYYKIYALLISKDLLNNCSPKDVILHLSRVYKVKIGNDWVLSEVPKKSRLLIEKLGIEKTIT